MVYVPVLVCVGGWLELPHTTGYLLRGGALGCSSMPISSEWFWG